MKSNPWPLAIILYFVIFVSAMAAWIVFAVRHDDELVRKDYYEQEMNFQREIDNSVRGASLDVKVCYEPTQQMVSISLPSEVSDGTIYFYRAARARCDREFPMALRDGLQRINVRDFENGLWKIRLSWISN